ncbi:alpha/beta hydrolase fold domain-containing protein [Luteibacter flocculans]|uniref:Alpha/beta hydrolase fold domain-containing protein n=1 Tax=Luteibacter flocculans TaxID=2780091 RepID=A0ABY4TBF0_9GAMM|nr:alpha/beta hydrolase fold domain-containing protein [Luteibacter flocculans]
MHGTLQLEPRQIPLPASISPAARAWMGKQITSEGVARHALMSLPEVTDHSGWKRLQAMSAALYAEMLAGKHGAAGAPLQTIREGATTMHVALPSHPKSDAVYLDVHGGALVFGEGEPCRVGAQQQAELHRLVCYAVDYRVPPDHPYPAALEDCLTAYRFLLARYPAEAIVVGGRSAGGNLAVAMLHRARDEGLPMPSGLVLLSPEVDLTESGDSFQTNRDLDVVLPRSLMKQNLLYAAGHDLAHPSLSPLFGTFEDFPPTFIQSGTRDLLLSNAVRLHRALRQAKVAAELHIFEGMPHGGFGGGTPEDDDLAGELTSFVDGCLALKKTEEDEREPSLKVWREICRPVI